MFQGVCESQSLVLGAFYYLILDLRPFVSHIKGLARKRAREEMKENAPAPKAKAVKQEPRSRGR